ncbi:hypothetical protein KSP40_PGU019799 [Platanthera guangdongensis]|uniref:Uncharacterized protein n=1 Tax=Platanthera guangdongensis TaxID=2320717 RepID=A0ABR2LM37_9ASPA
MCGTGLGSTSRWMKPPRLLSLTVDSALLHIACFVDLSAVTDLILVELFLWRPTGLEFDRLVLLDFHVKFL